MQKASNTSLFTKPLRLGGHTLTRRKSDATSPTNPPSEPLPPVPRTIPRMPSQDRLGTSLGATSPRSVASQPLPQEPQSPVFRMQPPVHNPSFSGHSHQPSWATPSAASQEIRDLDLPRDAPPVFRVMTDATERRRLQTELRVKPLAQSVYGRAIVHLLTLPWVVAPSGLAACYLGDGQELGAASDIASYINMLVCGAEAFAAPYADILAVHQLGHLNRLLVRSGLSPIAPGPLPQPWGPLAARQPPEFLLEGFKMRTAPPSQDSSTHA